MRERLSDAPHENQKPAYIHIDNKTAHYTSMSYGCSLGGALLWPFEGLSGPDLEVVVKQ